jgi:hypothetical protein
MVWKEEKQIVERIEKKGKPIVATKKYIQKGNVKEAIYTDGFSNTPLEDLEIKEERRKLNKERKFQQEGW